MRHSSGQEYMPVDYEGNITLQIKTEGPFALGLFIFCLPGMQIPCLEPPLSHEETNPRIKVIG